MRGVNKVILVGNIGKDPDVQTIEGNIPIAKFPLATTEMRKDKAGNQISETTWHNIILWRGLAELAQKYLKKGSQVYIEGKLRNWSKDDNGIKRTFTEIVGENLVMLDKRKDKASSENYSADTFLESSNDEFFDNFENSDEDL